MCLSGSKEEGSGMLLRCRHQLVAQLHQKKPRKKMENSEGPRADPSLTSSTSPAASCILPQNAGTPERVSHTAPTSASHRRSAHPRGLPAGSGTTGRGGTTPKASLLHQMKRPSLMGVTRRRGARRGRAPGSRPRAGPISHHPSWKRARSAGLPCRRSG